jgi:flagellar hook assembly protein FlgD
MTEYMNYLTQMIGVQEVSDAALQTVALSPNPSYKDIAVSFTLTQRAALAIEIYNIAGQHVRQLVHQHMDAGTHNLTWNGKDEQGRNSSSGTYIFTIRVNGSAISKTVVRLN